MRFGEQILTHRDGQVLIRLFHSTVSPGRREYREHHHTECELSLFLKGEGLYRVGDKTYDFESGDMFLFGSNEVHCITDIRDGTPFDLLNIHFEPRLLWSTEALPLLGLFNARSAAFENRILRAHPQTPLLHQQISELEKEMAADRPGKALKVRLDLFSVLLTLLREYGYVRQDAENATGDTATQLTAAMDFIEAHLCEPISLEDIARSAAMSRAYFSTVFKKYNGLSPWDYITIKRVEKAIEMLKNTSLNKLEIAAACGLGSQANFYKAFTRVTGKTPKEYTRK